MSSQLHWLEATGDHGPWQGRIAAEVTATWEHLAEFLPLPRLDILVQRLPTMIPEIGMPDADTWVNVPAATVLTAARGIAGAPLR